MYPVCKPGPWCLPGDPNPLCLLILLLAVHVGALWLGLSSRHGYTPTQASTWCVPPPSQLQLHHWPGTQGNPLLYLLIWMKAAKGPDVSSHWFLSRANKRAGERCWWNVHLFLSKAISPAASGLIVHMWCGGIHRNIDLFLVGVFLCLCWANTTLGWRSLESSNFTFPNNYVIFPCHCLAEHFC